MRRGGVGPCVAEGTEARALGGDRRQYIEQVARRSREPVKPRHHQHVVGVEWSRRGEAGRGRSSRRSPSREKSSRLRRRAIPSLARQRSGRRSIPGHSRKSCKDSAPIFCTMQGVDLERRGGWCRNTWKPHEIRAKGCLPPSRRADTGTASRAKPPRSRSATSATGISGLASNVLATSRSSSLSFGGRPPVRPARFAAASPARVRSRMRARSNSASALNMWKDQDALRPASGKPKPAKKRPTHHALAVVSPAPTPSSGDILVTDVTQVINAKLASMPDHLLRRDCHTEHIGDKDCHYRNVGNPEYNPPLWVCTPVYSQLCNDIKGKLSISGNIIIEKDPVVTTTFAQFCLCPN